MDLITEVNRILSNKIFFSLGVVIFNYFLTWIIIKLINQRVDNFKLRHSARRWTYYLLFFITIIILIFIWLKRTISLTTYIGFLSAGLTLALHQVVLDIAGWLVVIINRPFSLGDRIEWDNVQGDVIDIGVFYTTLLEVGEWVRGDQSTGRLVRIPNSTVFKAPLYNYTKGFGCVWNETEVLVTFESNWKKAKELMLTIAKDEMEENIEEKAKRRIKEMSKNYMIKYGVFTPITYVNIKESGVEIVVRYLASVRQRRMVDQRIQERILDKFNSESEINLAYPTTRIYRRRQESEQKV
ncbi:small-conductance mechanosensitive channel [Halobacteroides halobius DSM 5150]|uniref:Small-conductance mechanosensitive channel n=1 Tax=Halobacteroides halobius (strain ATCC 35273 / DSM 5150 / MD-1) TaxID=748449 RepID=L0KC86_HALHC|nr:mechanosensitive ion channel family protein [Halobacteroides halobius]AGB41693.1 small-conductance mechanosensitive channel [Halobacteroides halobius DSM 5150]